MESKGILKGHLLAGFTVLIWGSTFISTKVLLRAFGPVEILFIRFVLGLAALFLFRPKRFPLRPLREELLFLGAGLSGITLYYLLENIALTLTTAGNVGVMVAIAPFFTALLARVFLKEEKPRPLFYLGFMFSLGGVALISYNGATALSLNPLGDLLALLAALCWAVYSLLVRKIGELGHDTVLSTRRIFSYGLLFMLPLLFLTDFHVDLRMLVQPINLANLLFLGLGACAVCFVTWNTAVKLLGAVKTSAYIYAVPVITLIASALVLKERITPVLVVGAGLTLIGLWLSQTQKLSKK